MFDTLPISHLTAIMAHFCFPMLIAERPDSNTEFRTVAMNEALEEIAGPKDTIYGMALRDVVPATIVDEIIHSFAASNATVKMQQFKTTIHGIKREIPCELTMQYLQCEDGYDRILATAYEAQQENLDLHDKLAFEDIRYFSFIADLQLENLNSAFVTATDQVHVTPFDEDRIMRLHAVCRTVQRTVSDIRNVVRQVQARHKAQGDPQIVRTALTSKHPDRQHETNMLDALMDDCAAQSARLSN